MGLTTDSFFFAPDADTLQGGSAHVAVLPLQYSSRQAAIGLHYSHAFRFRMLAELVLKALTQALL